MVNGKIIYNMNLKENIRKILKEETKVSIKLLRRLNSIESFLMYSVNRRVKECGRFDGDVQFLRFIIQDVIEEMYFTHFEDVDDESMEWRNMYEFMEKYITEKFGQSIRNTYNINCGN